MDKVKLLFEGMSYGTKYIFLDEAKDNTELQAIAKKRGMVLPSPDLAIFKGIYAMIDEENKNGCTLPKAEVEKALNTLVGKAVDIDHYRRNVIGTWIDAKIVGKEIHTYGSIMKSNFDEEFAEFKNKMESGRVKISFEAWGNRKWKDTTDASKGYDLMDIHFAGGALLFTTKPAFDAAEVLEFAKVIETGDKLKEENINRDKSKGGNKMSDKIERTAEELASELNAMNGTVAVRDKEIKDLKTEKAIVEEELKTIKKSIDTITKEKATGDAKLKEVQGLYDEKIADEVAATIKARKEEIGEELAKDVSDEDMLDDAKFENLKLKKEVAELKKLKDLKPLNKAGLEAGNADNITSVQKKQNSIQKKAWVD